MGSKRLIIIPPKQTCSGYHTEKKAARQGIQDILFLGRFRRKRRTAPKYAGETLSLFLGTDNMAWGPQMHCSHEKAKRPQRFRAGAFLSLGSAWGRNILYSCVYHSRRQKTSAPIRRRLYSGIWFNTPRLASAQTT
jgi:hypothetical protein